MKITDEQAQRSAQERAEQGLPVGIESPAQVAQIAMVLRTIERRKRKQSKPHA